MEDGNPNVVWSASEDGTFRQHDFRECSSCPPAGSTTQECRNILVCPFRHLHILVPSVCFYLFYFIINIVYLLIELGGCCDVNLEGRTTWIVIYGNEVRVG